MEASSVDAPSSENLANNLNGISSYKDFLQHVDRTLQQVESDLVTFLRVSNLILESEQKQTSARMQQTLALLEDICSIRQR